MVQYQYDSWGKLLGITGSLASTIGKRNPFRYRGYYYDDETGMYYLQSRYYDPEIKRFICADNMKILQEQMDLYNKNLYVYCDNNPIIKKDATGEVGFWSVAIGAVTNIATSALTAVITGEEYTLKDLVKDGVEGGLTAFKDKLGTAFAIWGGITTTVQLCKEGVSLGKAVACGVLDGVNSAISLSMAAKFATKTEISKKIADISDGVFGFSTGLVCASVSKGVSTNAATNRREKKKKVSAPRRRRVIGKSYYYDPIRNIRRISLIWGYY